MSHIGYGIELKIGDGASSETFAALAELLDVSGPNLSMDTVETTHAGSTDEYKTFIAGLKDAGEVTCDVAFEPSHATQDESTGLVKKWNDRTLTNFQLAFPDSGSTTWTFSAYVTGFQPSEPIQDRATASVTLKITGALGWSV